MDAIIIDTETTSADDTKEVIELAWSSLDGPPEQNREFFCPLGEIQLGAVSTHHIFLEELNGMPPSSEAPKYVPAAAKYWIGHKIDFDWEALGQPPVRRICTLAMCRSIWPNLDSHSQTAMMYYLKGRTPAVRDLVRHAHGALADIGLTRIILSEIMDTEDLTNLTDLYAFSEEARIPKIMSFGKYKGEPVSAVDRGWANWYARQSDTDPYLITALKRWGKL